MTILLKSQPHPILFLALGLFGVYCIEFGVVGILPLIMQRFDVSASRAGMLVGLFALVIAAAISLLPQARLLVAHVHRLNQHALALTQGLAD